MRIGLFATGGTIGMSPAGEGPGVVPQADVDLLAGGSAIPHGIAVERHDLFAKPSASISLADVQTMADRIDQAFAEGMDGAVITHGTDTLEETAFALSLILGHDCPVVVTGAMRSADQLGADGPANVTAAIAIAASREARGIGPLVLFGDEIHAAQLVRKVHSSRPHAFSSEPFGPIGHVVEGRIHIALRPLLEPRRLRVSGPVPAVPILQAGLDLEPETVAAFLEAEIGALIIAGVGGGHVSSRVVETIERLAGRIPVILTSRVGMGRTLQASYAYDGSEIDLARRGVINGGRWRPAQARILAQILLSNGAAAAEIAAMLTR